MECKENHVSCKLRQYSVLIETLWNVKKGEQGDTGSRGTVLIETLWNVKSTEFQTG